MKVKMFKEILEEFSNFFMYHVFLSLAGEDDPWFEAEAISDCSLLNCIPRNQHFAAS